MKTTTPITRRHALFIAAAAGGAALLSFGEEAPALTWSGTALGAEARILLSGLSRDKARRVVSTAMEEVARLEAIFSLYQPNSELARLNRDGELLSASHDMRLLLNRALAFCVATGGAFNPAIQPVWRHLAEHFARHGEREPDRGVLRQLLERCDPQRIAVKGARVRLAPGGALTFNGIAQGYITDRVAELLREEGLSDILLGLGELRGLPGRDWQIAIPGRDGNLPLTDGAVATSEPAGTPLCASGAWHHLIDPRSGRSASYVKSVTVVARDATTADALSTALAVCPPWARHDIARSYPDCHLFGLAPGGEPLRFS